MKAWFPATKTQTKQLCRKVIALDDRQKEILNEMIAWLTNHGNECLDGRFWGKEKDKKKKQLMDDIEILTAERSQIRW